MMLTLGAKALLHTHSVRGIVLDMMTIRSKGFQSEVGQWGGAYLNFIVLYKFIGRGWKKKNIFEMGASWWNLNT